MKRVNFLHVEVKVYPASVEYSYTNYDWDTMLVAKEPVLSTDNVIGLPWQGSDELQFALEKWVDRETLAKGRELIFQNCPKAPEK